MISLYNLLFENTSIPQDLLDKEKKFLSKMDDLKDKLTNLNEDAKSDAILDRMEQLIRVMNKYKADGEFEALEILLNSGLTSRVGDLLSQKFLDYAYNNPEGIVKYGVKRLKRDIAKGEKITDFNDPTLKFSQNKLPLDTPKGTFVKSVFDFILNSEADQSSKFALIDIIKDPRNLIPGSAFEGDSVSGNLIDLLPKKIQNNKAFKEVANNILRFKQGRAVGAGEGFLTVFGKNAQPSKAKNDINIDGVDAEVKASPGGQQFSIDDGGGDKGKGIDQMNKRYFPFLKKGSDFKINSPEFIEYIKEKGKPHLQKYFTELYPVIGDSDISEITNITWNNLGKDKKEMGNLVKNIIFKSYKQQHKFDSFIVIDPNSGDFVATSSDKLPDSLVGVDWALIKGKDTQAVPAGFVRLSMR
jgi:hypothetical protein